jgi:hypothetical protein
MRLQRETVARIVGWVGTRHGMHLGEKKERVIKE